MLKESLAVFWGGGLRICISNKSKVMLMLQVKCTSLKPGDVENDKDVHSFIYINEKQKLNKCLQIKYST
jgi:hypothetical protein